ncbi:MAG TPA: hypothetical protein VMU61_14475 [Candidatus Aquilonibacter sp.]|nr:hypothetical protein [Candidatus Aquilonibacter sp.]
MEPYVLQESDFSGNVKQSSRRRHSFYRYSLWRVRSGEHLFDGAAGDLAEALDTMRAHIRYLTAGEQTAAGE